MEFIGCVDPAKGHLAMLDLPVEVAIVDSNLNTIYHSRCRPKDLPPLGHMTQEMWKDKHKRRRFLAESRLATCIQNLAPEIIFSTGFI